MKTLVLGFACGIQPSDLNRFIESALKATEDNCDIILFCDRNFSNKRADQSRLKILWADSFWSGAGKDRFRVRWALTYFLSRIILATFTSIVKFTKYLLHSDTGTNFAFLSFFKHPTLARYLQYFLFLKNNWQLYTKVLVTDVRDVYFQNDPFTRFSSDQLIVFREPENMMCNEERNSRWLRLTYGRKTAIQLSKAPAICSGVTMGGTEMIVSYIEKMCEEIAVRNGIPYSDQGIHNFLIHTKKVSATILDNEDGLVLTAGASEISTTCQVTKTEILNVNSISFSILHQFDRNQALLSHISGKTSFSVQT